MACGLLLAGRRQRRKASSCARTRIAFADLPPAFDGFTILQLSDLHVEMSAARDGAGRRALRRAQAMTSCVLTGDYRAKT